MELKNPVRGESKVQAAAPARRMGAKSSANWSLMLDAAETILCEEGCLALTSRRVAEQVGVKQRLVYYYFRTMAELEVETFRRMVRREMERLKQAAASPQPIKAFWTVATQTSDPRLIAEFMALANHNAELKKEVTAFVEISRKMQVAALSPALTAQTKELSPEAIAILATSLALTLNREAALGVKTGHIEVAQFVSAFLGRIEP